MQSSLAFWKHQLRIILAFGWMDFLQKYRGSFLGYLWSLANPVLQFIVILHVFRPVLGQAVPSYPLYVFFGLIVWEYFSVATTALIAVPQQKFSILQKWKVWPLAFVLASGWTSFLIFCTRFALYVFLALALGVRIPGTAFWYVSVMVLQMMLLTFGIGAFLGAFSLRLKDIPHLWSVALSVLFWMTPVVYLPFRTGNIVEEIGKISPAAFSSILTSLLNIQPVSMLLFDARRALGLLPASPPSALHIVLFTAACACVCFLGMRTYLWRSSYFLQEY